MENIRPTETQTMFLWQKQPASNLWSWVSLKKKISAVVQQQQKQQKGLNTWECGSEVLWDGIYRNPLNLELNLIDRFDSSTVLWNKTHRYCLKTPRYICSPSEFSELSPAQWGNSAQTIKHTFLMCAAENRSARCCCEDVPFGFICGLCWSRTLTAWGRVYVLFLFGSHPARHVKLPKWIQ